MRGQAFHGAHNASLITLIFKSCHNSRDSQIYAINMSAPDSTLVHILTSCLSPDPAVRVPAEATLQASLSQAHGVSIQLLDVVLAAETVPQHVRALAATCFKNCIAKRWKKVQVHALSPAEKAQARVLCTSCLLLHDSAIFKIIIAAAAKMLRADWAADEWPNLLPSIISLASSPDPASARRGIQALHNVVRELSSMSLLSERQKFHAACPHIASAVAPSWQQLLPLVPSSVDAADAARTVAKVYKHSLLRCAALAVPGSPVFVFLESCCQILSFTSDICSGRTQCACPVQVVALARTICSCFRACIKALPVQYSQILPNVAGTTMQILASCTQAHAVNDAAASLTCRAISVLEYILYEGFYKPSSSSRALSDAALKDQAVAAFNSIFTSATIGQLVDLLSSSYCGLSLAQLGRWEESPEAFSNECDSQVLGFNICLLFLFCLCFVCDWVIRLILHVQGDALPSGRAVRLVMQLAHRFPEAGACGYFYFD